MSKLQERNKKWDVQKHIPPKEKRFVGQALPLATVFRRQAERLPYNLEFGTVDIY